jgi:hypothetical protein
VLRFRARFASDRSDFAQQDRGSVERASDACPRVQGIRGIPPPNTALSTGADYNALAAFVACKVAALFRAEAQPTQTMASASPSPAYDAVESGSWWQQVLPVVVGLGGFAIYATLRAFEGNYFQWGPYLSPFYPSLIDVHHRYWPYSPALLILAGPLGFRATCYYYRKAYYRAFFLDPPACAVPERRGRVYCGETRFPFHSSECAPVFSVPGSDLSGLPLARCRSWFFTGIVAGAMPSPVYRRD